MYIFRKSLFSQTFRMCGSTIWINAFKKSEPSFKNVVFQKICFWKSIHNGHRSYISSAGKDAFGSAMPGTHLRSLAVFRCRLLLANEREEAHMDVPCVWQTCSIWAAHHWWVSLGCLWVFLQYKLRHKTNILNAFFFPDCFLKSWRRLKMWRRLSIWLMAHGDQSETTRKRIGSGKITTLQSIRLWIYVRFSFVPKKGLGSYEETRKNYYYYFFYIFVLFFW